MVIVLKVAVWRVLNSRDVGDGGEVDSEPRVGGEPCEKTEKVCFSVNASRCVLARTVTL